MYTSGWLVPGLDSIVFWNYLPATDAGRPGRELECKSYELAVAPPQVEQ
jgi:hypothetical protein